jgi:hypothetical protein
MEPIQYNQIKIVDVASHRNGVEGAPFHVVLFEDGGEDGSRKVAFVFDEPAHCAVLDVAKLAEGKSDSVRIPGEATATSGICGRPSVTDSARTDPGQNLWGPVVDTPPGTRRGGARPAPSARYRMMNSAGLTEAVMPMSGGCSAVVGWTIVDW